MYLDFLVSYPFSRTHCPGRDHVTEISPGFTVDRLDFGRSQGHVRAAWKPVLRNRPCDFYETLYGIVREVDKIHVFPEQNGAKYRVSCSRFGKISKISQQHFAAKYRGERSRICPGLPGTRGTWMRLMGLLGTSASGCETCPLTPSLGAASAARVYRVLAATVSSLWERTR